MHAQILDVQHGVVPRLEHAEGFRQRRRVRPRENPLSNPRAEGMRPLAPDEMQQTSPCVADRPLNRLSQRFVILRAQMLQHSHRDERIVSPGDVPVVILDELDLAIEAFFARPFAGHLNLLMRNVERRHPRAVMPRHMQRQRAPAAARLHHVLARLQPYFSAHVIHLRQLRLFQCFCLVRKIRAGVNQTGIKPQFVKIDIEVVVVMNVLC